MAILFTNNASATIASTISSSATSITVASGQGAEFPVLTGSDYFIATLVDSSNNIEIIKVTARSSDTMTVVRGQESTSARSYTVGSLLELRVTAATLSSFAQQTGGTITAATITASTQFTGPGTGLTGTAASLTAGVATLANTSTTQAAGTSNTTIATTAFVAAAMAVLYPVGSIYTSTVATNPNTLFGFGTWVAFAAGKVLVGVDTGFAAGTTGGNYSSSLPSHTHTGTTDTTSITGGIYGISESFMSGGGVAGGVFSKAGGYVVNNTPVQNDPSDGGAAILDATHSHTFTTAASGTAGTNANMQPYVVVYMWNRTA
jgi:hypothetical protein